jgi:hypothetical protein
MISLKRALPLALAVGLVAAAPAGAHGTGSHAKAKAAGGDVAPTLPSIVRVRVNRGEKALEKASNYVDRNQNDKAITALLGARRNMYAAWKGAQYVIETAPPPVAGDASVHRVQAHKSGGAPAGTVYADPVTTAVAVLGFQHDVAATGYSLLDGGKGTLLAAANTTVFAALDRRDQAIAYIAKLPAPPAAADARVHRVTAHKADDAALPTFATLMPNVVPDLDDEEQQIQGLMKDGAVTPKGKTLLKDALVQVILTENTINTNWPPAPAEG